MAKSQATFAKKEKEKKKNSEAFREERKDGTA